MTNNFAMGKTRHVAGLHQALGLAALLQIAGCDQAPSKQPTNQETRAESPSPDSTTTTDAQPAQRYLASPQTQFHGYACTFDCSGHEAGYEWAEENGIDDPDECGGNSDSFIEGCQAYAEEQVAENEENDAEAASDDDAE